MDDDRKLAEQEAADRKARREHQAMLRWMLSQKPARRFLTWLLFDPGAANLHGTVFDRDPQVMAVRVGIQQVGLALQEQLMDAASAEYCAMVAEMLKERENIPSEAKND